MNKFQEVMSQRTDEELIKILTVDIEKYNATAIQAAESEVEKRNIDTSKFTKIKEKAIAEKEKKEKVDSNVVSSFTRFLNFIIDTIVCFLLAFILSVLIEFFIPLNDSNVITIFVYICIFGTFIAYYTIMEIKFQKTVGKFITNTKVVTMNGEKPENSVIIARTFYRLIPFDRFSFLFVKNGIHDYLSKTNVVRDSLK